MPSSFRVLSSHALLRAALPVLAAFPAAVRAQWTAVLLEPPGANTSACYRVQDGQQVGMVDYGSGPEAVRWAGTAASIVSLHPPGHTQSFARGAAVGRQAGLSYPASVAHAGYWTGTATSFVDLHPSSNPNANQSSAFDLTGNALVGEVRISNITRATVWNLATGAPTDLHPTTMSPPPTYSTIAATDGLQHVGSFVAGLQQACVWDATSGTFTNLHPGGTLPSYALDVHLGQQVGFVQVGSNNHAALWTGTAASFVDLTPPGFTRSEAAGVHAGQQVGSVFFGGIFPHAAIWDGTAASFVDLHGFLPATFTASQAFGIWHDVLGTTYVVGAGSLGGHQRAVLWIKNATGWSNVGFAKAGALGPPSLVGSGPLTNGSSNTVTLTGAIQNANTLLVIGVLGAYAPLLGGVLVPDPLIVVPLVTNASGTVAWSFPQPGLPPGFPLRFQHWIEDGTASFGYTASNGLLGICQ